METYINKIKLFTKVYNKFKSIENEKDLKKNKLTLADYDILFDVLQELNKCDSVWCLSENLADWCKKQGLFVTPPISSAESSYSCVNYSISIIEQDK